MDFLLHLFNFVAPAFGVAVLLPLGARWVFGAKAGGMSWSRQVLVIGLVGSLVLWAGLWLLGRDAKMLTYAALILACATCQFVMNHSGRR
jgi:Flp pilus assembly protein protease CpaA